MRAHKSTPLSGGREAPTLWRRRRAGSWWRQRGQALLLFALLLPVMIFGVGIAFDVGYWYTLKRQQQTAADMAALIGAQGITTSTNASNNGAVITPANVWLNNNGVPNVCITNTTTLPTDGCVINHPPLTGQYENGVGDPVVVNKYKFVEVIVVKPAPKFFLNALEGMLATFGIGTPPIYARAVAGGISPLEYAIMGLDDDNPTGGSCPTGSADPICWSGGPDTEINGNICSAGGIALDNNVTVNGIISSNDPSADAVTYPAGWSGDPGSIVVGSADPCVDPGCGNRDSLPAWAPTVTKTGDATPSAGHASTTVTHSSGSATYSPGQVMDIGHNHPPVACVGCAEDLHYLDILEVSGGTVTINPNTADFGWRQITVSGGTVTFNAGSYYRSTGSVDDFEITGGTVTIQPGTSFKNLVVTGGATTMAATATGDKFAFDNYNQKGGTATMRGAFYADDFCFGTTCATGSASSDPIVLGTTNTDYSQSTPPTTTTFVARNRFDVLGPTQFGQNATTRISAEANGSVPCNLLIWLLGKGTYNKVFFGSNANAFMNGTIYAPVIDSGGPAVHVAGNAGDQFVLDAGQIIAANYANTGNGTADITWRASSAIFIAAPYLAE